MTEPTVCCDFEPMLSSYVPEPVTFDLTRGTNITEAVMHLSRDMSNDVYLADSITNPILYQLQRAESTRNRSEICAFYNVGKCLKLSPHLKNPRLDSGRKVVHMCAFCNAKLNLSFPHNFSECPFVVFKSHLSGK